jgi:D-alanyl-D-alanine dipeptidase
MDGWNKNLLLNNHPAFNEPLVPLGIFSKYKEIFSDGIYFGERKTSPYNPGELKDTLLTSFVREGIAKLLAEASILLPAGYVFMTLDTYRTEKVQRSLFENYKNKLKESPFNRSEEEAIIETQKYVSLPSRQDSPHMTGGAVDITIIKIDNEASWKEYKALTQKLKDGEFNIKQWKKIYEIEMRRNQLLREKGKMLDMGVVFDQVAIDELGQDKTSLRCSVH